MARQKITVESRLRTENTRLREDLGAAEQETRSVRGELASRDAAIAELQYQLKSASTQLALSKERLEKATIAASINARMLASLTGENEKLRYPPAERG